MTHTNFQIFLKSSLTVMLEIFDLLLRAVIAFFLNWDHKIFDWKKIESNRVMSKALFGVANPK